MNSLGCTNFTPLTYKQPRPGWEYTMMDQVDCSKVGLCAGAHPKTYEAVEQSVKQTNREHFWVWIPMCEELGRGFVNLCARNLNENKRTQPLKFTETKQ